jgi:hypothetical protein
MNNIVVAHEQIPQDGIAHVQTSSDCSAACALLGVIYSVIYVTTRSRKDLAFNLEVKVRNRTVTRKGINTAIDAHKPLDLVVVVVYDRLGRYTSEVSESTMTLLIVALPTEPLPTAYSLTSIVQCSWSATTGAHTRFPVHFDSSM